MPEVQAARPSPARMYSNFFMAIRLNADENACNPEGDYRHFHRAIILFPY